jgi:hypothetical protein
MRRHIKRADRLSVPFPAGPADCQLPPYTELFQTEWVTSAEERSKRTRLGGILIIWTSGQKVCLIGLETLPSLFPSPQRERGRVRVVFRQSRKVC